MHNLHFVIVTAILIGLSYFGFSYLVEHQGFAFSPTNNPDTNNNPTINNNNPSTNVSPNETSPISPEYEPAPDPSVGSVYQLGCYVNDAGHFSLGYPTFWEKIENPNKVIFLAPLEDSNDAFREGIEISFKSLSSHNARLEDYVKSTDDSNRKLAAFALVESGPTTVVDNGPTAVSNITAFKNVYTWNNGQNQLKALQILTIKDDKLITFIYNAEPNKYDNYLPDIMQVINSLDYCSPFLSTPSGDEGTK